jgi:shikimate dehydrogenase
MTMQICGKTQTFGVIGDPIEHTLSPAMQNAAFSTLKLGASFLAFHVKSENVGDAIRGMRALSISGLNVTMPHKKAVIPFLDEMDESSRFLESVNTIQNHNGKLRGFSTDGVGAHRALEENGVTVKDKKLVLLGGGGAARAIAYTVAREVGELVLLNRTPQKTAVLTEALNSKFHTKIVSVPLTSESIRDSLKGADILVNATSVGMYPNHAQSPVKAECLSSNLAVMDIIYHPVKTKLAKAAKSSGCKVISGVEMLLFQGAASFEIWTGKHAPIEVMRRAALKQLKNR